MKPILIQSKPHWSLRDLSEMVEFRWVLFMLILRDFKLRYKQTYLGVLWVTLQPLATAFLLRIIFGSWMHLPSNGIHYMPFAFCGLIPWLVFSQSVQRASVSLVNEAHLVKKIYFPRLYLPLSGTFGVGLDFLIALTIFCFLALYYGVPFTWKLSFLPLCALLLFLFSSAVNILLSSLSAYYRDFKHIIPFLLQFWMYASPIAYSSQLIPSKWHWLFHMNPLVGIIELFRWTLLDTFPFSFLSCLFSAIETVLFFLISLITFRKLEHRFADVL